MKYYVEDSLSNFKFWSGACDRAEMLTVDELNAVEDNLGILLGDEYSDTAINDLFWFDFETVCHTIGRYLNSKGNVIRSVSDVDECIVAEAVGDWAEDQGYELTNDQVKALAVAIAAKDGLELTNETTMADDGNEENGVDIDDDIGLACAEELGFSLAVDEDEAEDHDDGAEK